MQTRSTKQEDFTVSKIYEHQWWVLDVNGLSLGRISSYIAKILRGKHLPYFSPHVDCGDYVVVINAKKIKLTGQKLTQKMYYWHTGYIGGIKMQRADFRLSHKPESLIYHAVKKMLPKNTLNRKILHKLKVYAGEDHPHEANKPQKLVWNKTNRYSILKKD
ncbi:MAG: 50S ribosomal protein L13 [SAR324 cluster bacterium]|nr:50S ribosomal protein L13 [SAR324 cluster bacterium]